MFVAPLVFWTPNADLVVRFVNTLTFVAPNLAWGKARRASIPRQWGCDRGATQPQAKFGATRRAAVLFRQTSLLAPYRSTSGYARRSRLVWPKNPLPRT